MILGLLILFFAYFFCMMALLYGFKKLPIFSEVASQPSTHFTIIIPFRNEAKNLPNLLSSIEKLNYPSEFFEIIFVNDASEDDSEAIILAAIDRNDISIKLIQNKRISNSPKKDAITEAIRLSNMEWILTTDADCSLPENWLKSLDAFIRKHNPVMVAGPVIYSTDNTLLENFQQLDGLSLQAVTIGSFGLLIPLLSNGANLAYQKETFLKVNGFTGNNHIASGDDIFLLEKMKKVFPKRVKFLKSREAIVITQPQTSWKNLVNQHIRWASKTSKIKNSFSTILGLLVFLTNLSLLGLPIFMIFDAENMGIYVLLLYFKILTDYLVVRQTGLFFEEKVSFWKFHIQTFIYAAFVLRVVVGSLWGNYNWKGRSYGNR